MEQKQKNTSAGNSTNPVSQKQGVTSQVTVNPKQDDIKAIRGKAYEALLTKDGAFSSMYALNPMITGDVVNALLDFFIVNSDEPHPIEILGKEPSKTIWQSFFRAYQEPGQATDSNTKNPSQSFRNMLSSFPAKAKAVMVALNEAGLPTNWIMPKNSKRISFSQEDEKEINSLLQKAGVLNPSMDLKDKYKIYKALGGKLTSRLVKQQLKQQ